MEMENRIKIIFYKQKQLRLSCRVEVEPVSPIGLQRLLVFKATVLGLSTEFRTLLSCLL